MEGLLNVVPDDLGLLQTDSETDRLRIDAKAHEGGHPVRNLQGGLGRNNQRFRSAPADAKADMAQCVDKARDIDVRVQIEGKRPEKPVSVFLPG